MGHTTLLYRMMYSFRMPLFMFISGFLMIYTTFLRHESPPSPRRFIRSKIERLLIPYLVLTLITFVPRALMSSMADDTIELSPNSLLIGTIYGDQLVIPFFWFIQASFLLLTFSYVIFYYGNKLRLPSSLIYGSLIVLTIIILNLRLTSLFSINQVARLGLYFILGACYCRWNRSIDNVIHWTRWREATIFTISWVVLFFATQGSRWTPLCSIAGIAMCISITKLMEHYDIRALDHLIGANYIIFLLSWYFNVLTQQVLAHYVEFPWWIHTVLSLVSGIYIPWLALRYLQSHPSSRWIRVIAWLLGQRMPKPATP